MKSYFYTVFLFFFHPRKKTFVLLEVSVFRRSWFHSSIWVLSENFESTCNFWNKLSIWKLIYSGFVYFLPSRNWPFSNFKRNCLCKKFDHAVSFSHMNFLWALNSECTCEFLVYPEFWVYREFCAYLEFWLYPWILDVPLNFERTPEFWVYPRILSVPQNF